MGKSLRAYIQVDGIGSPYSPSSWMEIQTELINMGFKNLAKLLGREEGEVITGNELIGCEKEISTLYYMLSEDLKSKKDVPQAKRELLSFLYTYAQLSKTYHNLLMKFATPEIEPIILRFQ